MNKYNNKHCEYNGIKFDSQMEMEYYKYIELNYENIEVHPKFELLPVFEYQGKKIRAITYEADFMYKGYGDIVVVDIKGFETSDFKLKEKMFKYKYPNIKFMKLTYVKKYGGRIELDELKKLIKQRK